MAADLPRPTNADILQDRVKPSPTMSISSASDCTCLSSLFLLPDPDQEVKPPLHVKNSFPVEPALLPSPGTAFHRAVPLQSPKSGLAVHRQGSAVWGHERQGP